MSSILNNLNRPIGRTAIISFLIAAILAVVSIIIPLANPVTASKSWYKFLYNNGTFNWPLVILESIVLIIMYFFLVVCLGSFAEINNRLPSWGEVIAAIIITLIFALFAPKLSISGQTSASVVNNFSSHMQAATFWFTVLGIIIMTLYIIFSEDKSK